MIVIDASSIAKYILKEDYWEMVETYLSDEPYSLTLALAEVSNAIWKHTVLFKIVSSKEAMIMYSALMKLKDYVLVLEPIEKYLQEAMKIAMNKNITIYDAIYIAQAKTIGKLLTSDKKQYEAAKESEIDVEYVE